MFGLEENLIDLVKIELSVNPEISSDELLKDLSTEKHVKNVEAFKRTIDIIYWNLKAGEDELSIRLKLAKTYVLILYEQIRKLFDKNENLTLDEVLFNSSISVCDINFDLFTEIYLSAKERRGVSNINISVNF